MPLWLREWIDKHRRRAAGRPVRSTVALILLFWLVGELQLFAPYDWAQQSLTARINRKPYTGDITVISLDNATKERFGQPGLVPDQLARLLERVAAGNPRQIVIDRVPLLDARSQDMSKLAATIRQLKIRPAMWVEVVPLDDATARNLTKEGKRKPGMKFGATTLGDELAPLVDPTGWLTWTTPFGAPWGQPRTAVTASGTVPSIAQILADHPASITDGELTDLSIDPATIPTVSALALLDGKASTAQFSGRRILISSSGDPVRDLVRSPHGGFTPRAALIVQGAQTVAEGKLKPLGYGPSLVVAIAAAWAWLIMRRRAARLVVLLALISIVVSPLLLEPRLIYQETSSAVFLLLFVGVAHLIASIRSALALARNAAETKSWFLAQASHDLRQPIHAIGMLAARLGQTELTPAQADLVDKIDRSVDGASRMFQSLLDIATIESGSLKPVIGPVSVNDLFSDLEGQNALAAERRGVELRFVPSDLTLLTDRSLALTMLQNVVSNAIKYASGKRVLVGCRRRGNSAVLCVFDRGEGISKEDLLQVTKAFFRASRGNAGAEGTGLGLAIVHRLADLLRLRFEIQSNPGRGTGVMISGFPLGEAQAAAQAAPPVAAAPTPLAGMRVLLVDDDLASLRAMEALLDQWGCVVKALDHFPVLSESYDAVITDYDFGQGHTLARYREPVAELVSRGVSVAVISGHSPDLVRKEVGQQSLLVLAKPVRPAELRAVLLSAKLKAAG